MPSTARGIIYPTTVDNFDPPGDLGALATSTNDALDDLDETIPSVLAYDTRSTSKTGVTTEAGMFRFDDIPILAGHSYRIEVTGCSIQPSGADATFVGAIRTRITTDGTTPTTSSTEAGIHRMAWYITGNAPFFSFATRYKPASNETLSVLWTAARETSTNGGTTLTVGAATGGMKFAVIDEGLATGAITGTVI